MDMLIAILLWLGCIQAPNTYTPIVINGHIVDNASAVNAVLSNQAQQGIIWTQYGNVVPTVQIVDPLEL